MSVDESEIGRSSRRRANSGTNSTPPLSKEVFDIFLGVCEIFGLGRDAIDDI